jgi:hypothetical protein
MTVLKLMDLALVAAILLGLFQAFCTAASIGILASMCHCKILALQCLYVAGGKDCCDMPKLKAFKPTTGKKEICDNTVVILQRQYSKNKGEKDGLDELHIMCQGGQWKVIGQDGEL